MFSYFIAINELCAYSTHTRSVSHCDKSIFKESQQSRAYVRLARSITDINNSEKNIYHRNVSVVHRNNFWNLTLNVRGPSYLGLNRSISWLLMPWLLASPGHQQSWYWLCKIRKSWSYTRKDFNYLRHVSVEEWHKMQILVYFSSEKFSTQRVYSIPPVYVIGTTQQS